MVGSDVAKQPLLGWQILAAFDGIGDGQSFGHLLVLSGSWDVGELLDDESCIYEDLTSGFQTLAGIWQRVLGLAHCGVPYRLFLLSDLAKDTMPAYRTWFFPNLFKVDDRVIDLLRRRALRDGNVAIFGPATGITDGRYLSAEGASRLLGLPMELLPRTTTRHVIVQDRGHPITRELAASATFGDTLPYGPTLVPAEWAVQNAGSHIWCEQDDVVYASDSLVAMHSVKAGPRTIRLPGPSTVTDALTGRKLGDAMTEITVEVDPPATFIYTL